MHKTLLILRQELITTFSRPTYIFFAFVFPMAAVLILAVVQFVQSRSESSSDSEAQDEFSLQVEGYVDQSELVQVIPDDIPAGQLLDFASEAQARQAMAAGEISAYYVIPADYLQRGEIYYIFPENKSLISDGQDWLMRWTLTFNLLGGDTQAAERAWNPMRELEAINLTPQAATGPGEDCSQPGSACESNDLIRYIPAIMVVLFYISFMSSGNMLFASIGNEKENRTIEVLLMSISPRQLLTGKTVGLGIAGLLQTLTWLASTFILFNMGGQTLNLPDNFSFPFKIIAWSLVFFLGGFAVYASLMAGVGAMVPKIKEAGSATLIVMLPLLAGYMVGLLAPMAGAADKALPVFLSFFPLTAPVVMVMRLTDSTVSLWQLLLSAGLTYITAYFILRGVASMFKAQNLLSGQPFSLKRYFSAFIDR